jgi:hypothetical protein
MAPAGSVGSNVGEEAPDEPPEVVVAGGGVIVSYSVVVNVWPPDTIVLTSLTISRDWDFEEGGWVWEPDGELD